MQILIQMARRLQLQTKGDEMMYYKSIIDVLHEAVPRKAKALGLNPEAPPDMNDPNLGKNDTPQPPQDIQDTPEVEGGDQPPTDDSGAPPSDDMAGGDSGGVPADGSGDMSGGDPDAGEGDPAAEGDPNAEDPNAAPDDMGQAAGGDEKETAEQELFKDLKPEQLEIKKKELRERFQDLYQITADTIEKLNKVTKTSYDANMIDLSLRQLLNLKDLIHQSITKAFTTRTYVENKIELEKCAALFNSITTTIGMVYESRAKRAQLDKPKLRGKDLNIDFHQDLGF